MDTRLVRVSTRQRVALGQLLLAPGMPGVTGMVILGIATNELQGLLPVPSVFDVQASID